MSQVEPSQARRIADEILALPNPDDWAAALDRRRHEFTADLARALRRCAASELRSRPTHAACAARLAERVSMALGGVEDASVALRMQARAMVLLARYGSANELLERASRLAAASGAESHEDENDALRIEILVHLGRHADAREVARRVLESAGARGDKTLSLRAHMALADLAWRQDRPREALRHYRLAERLLPHPVPPRTAAVLAANRANALVHVNRFRAAARQHARARELFESQGCGHTVAQVDYNAAWVDTLLGRFQDALRKLTLAERAFAEHGDERHLAQISLDRAEVYLRLHHAEDALHFAREARRRFEALEVEKECGQALALCARAAALQGEGAEALRAWRAAARIFAGLGLVAREVEALTEAARTALDEGRGDLARRVLDRARSRDTADLGVPARCALDLVEARIALTGPAPDPGRAEALARDVLSSLRRVHAPALEIEAWHLTGRARGLGGSVEAAIAAYRRAVDLLERFREGVPPDEYMTTFLGAHAGLYEEIVAVLLDAGDVELAFEYCERAKSRALSDLLEQPAVPGAADLGPSVRRARFLRERLHGMYRVLGRLPSERSAGAAVRRRVRGATQECEQELARCLRQIQLERVSRPRTSASLPTRAEIARALGAGTVLLEYFLTESWLAVFVLTRDGVVAVRRPVDATALRLRVERFHFHLSQFQRPYAPPGELALASTRANLEALAAELVAPVSAHLERRIVVVPHGDLHHVPFHALPHGDGWLADEFEVLYAPSAAVYVACGERSARARTARVVFGLGDDDTPFIEHEARRVAHRLRTTDVFLGADASWAALERAAPTTRVLHVATHGMYRRPASTVSAIQLADQWVTPFDLQGLDLDGAFVVLSACEGRTADVRGGDEALGLTRGFLAARASGLLSAQWRVRDDVTAAFMDGFYEALVRVGDPVAAYAEAMRGVRLQHPHPYHWAPFFLTGQPAPIPVPPLHPPVVDRETVPCTSSPRGSER